MIMTMTRAYTCFLHHPGMLGCRDVENRNRAFFTATLIPRGCVILVCLYTSWEADLAAELSTTQGFSHDWVGLGLEKRYRGT